MWSAETQQAEWKGYDLDASGAPSFRYEWHGVKVTDSFSAEGNGMLPNPGTKLHRHITLAGSIPANAWLCLATAAKITEKDGSFECESQGKSFVVRTTGAKVIGKSLLLPAQAGEVKVSYHWK
jgi:hypothetical protein